MRYEPSSIDRFAAVLMGLRALYALSFITIVIAALTGVLNLRALDPELARFFALQPPQMFGLWCLYVFGYLYAAILIWTGRPTRSLIAYVLSFSLDIILWTLVVTVRIDVTSMPSWGHLADLLITLFDLGALSYLTFVVLTLRKQDSMRWT